MDYKMFCGVQEAVEPRLHTNARGDVYQYTDTNADSRSNLDTD